MPVTILSANWKIFRNLLKPVNLSQTGHEYIVLRYFKMYFFARIHNTICIFYYIVTTIFSNMFKLSDVVLLDN